MSFAIPRGYDPPAAPTGSQWLFRVASKTFEANNLTLLEGAINTWLLVLEGGTLEYVVLTIDYQSGAKEKAIVTYGSFINVTP
jgi:hypothetical protein